MADIISVRFFHTMRDTILIAPDKFKGTLTAFEVAEIIAEELSAFTSLQLLQVPMSDGGEGTPHQLNGAPVIVSNDLIGPQFYPGIGVLDRSSFPLGMVIREILETQKPFYVGIGGTATVDGGAGALQALGALFFDESNRIITEPITPRHLLSISRIIANNVDGILAERCTMLCDVKASLLGPGLSSLDFAEQKGASPEDKNIIIKALKNFQKLLPDIPLSPFAGAGGGLPFSLTGIAGADSVSGAQYILATKNIDWERIALVITGEGSLDFQTSGGKVVETVCREAVKRKIPTLIVAGYEDGQFKKQNPSINVISCIQDKKDFLTEKAYCRLQECLRNNLPDIISKIVSKEF